jgi:hypothetical protein
MADSHQQVVATQVEPRSPTTAFSTHETCRQAPEATRPCCSPPGATTETMSQATADRPRLETATQDVGHLRCRAPLAGRRAPSTGRSDAGRRATTAGTHVASRRPKTAPHWPRRHHTDRSRRRRRPGPTSIHHQKCASPSCGLQIRPRRIKRPHHRPPRERPAPASSTHEQGRPRLPLSIGEKRREATPPPSSRPRGDPGGPLGLRRGGAQRGGLAAARV